MLQEIKKLFQERHTISLYDLKVHFDTDEAAMKDMLNVWIQKGKLTEVARGGSSPCEGCVSDDCDFSKYLFYEWVG